VKKLKIVPIFGGTMDFLWSTLYLFCLRVYGVWWTNRVGVPRYYRWHPVGIGGQRSGCATES